MCGCTIGETLYCCRRHSLTRSLPPPPLRTPPLTPPHSAFFYLLPTLLSGLWWFVIPPLRVGYLWWHVLIGVALQEASRCLFFALYALATKKVLSVADASPNLALQPMNDLSSALAAGIGFGAMQVVVNYGTVLSAALDSRGGATFFTPSCSGASLFLASALTALCFFVMQVCWTVATFFALRRANLKRWGWLCPACIAMHYAASLSTLFNSVEGGWGCAVSIPAVAILALLAAAGAAVLACGMTKSFDGLEGSTGGGGGAAAAAGVRRLQAGGGDAQQPPPALPPAAEGGATLQYE